MKIKKEVFKVYSTKLKLVVGAEDRRQAAGCDW